jgi:preprotein translocase subunit SecF
LDIWGETRIDFLGLRKFAYVLSAVFVVIGIAAVAAIPLGRANLGTDFAGGVSVQFRFSAPVSIEAARGVMAEAGFKDASLQHLKGEERLLIRLKSSEGDLREVTKAVGEVFARGLPDNPFTIDSISEVGPTVGRKLQRDALWAICISLVGILIYVAWRFEFRFGLAAVAATLHDVLAVMGLFYVLDREMTLLIVTALLTLAGYSLTDTVVVFDRIRENLRKKGKEEIEVVINRSINEVLRRTIVTSLTTVLAIIPLLFMGGETIFDFSLALFVGVIVGTYSSIFIASPLLLVRRGKGVRRKKGADALPGKV